MLPTTMGRDEIVSVRPEVALCRIRIHRDIDIYVSQSVYTTRLSNGLLCAYPCEYHLDDVDHVVRRVIQLLLLEVEMVQAARLRDI